MCIIIYAHILKPEEYFFGLFVVQSGRKKKMGNLTFVIVSLLIIAAIIALSVLLEKRFSQDRKAFGSTHFITYTAMFSCIAGILMLIDFPLGFAPSFYKLDLSEMPVLICTFYLGPVAGTVCEFIKVVIKLLLKGTSTAYVGDFANFVVGCTFILPASLIYHAKPGKKTALIGMIVGTIIMAIFGSAFNAVYLIPKFAEIYGMPVEVIVGMGTKVNGHITSVATLAAYAVAPFNIVKGAIVSALTFLLYKRISPILHKSDKRMLERRANS